MKLKFSLIAVLIGLTLYLGGAGPRLGPAENQAAARAAAPYVEPELWSSETDTLDLIVTASDSQAAAEAVQRQAGQVGSDLWLIDAVAASLPTKALAALAAEPEIVSVVSNKAVATSQEPVDWQGWASGRRIEKGNPQLTGPARQPAVALPDGGFALVSESGIVVIANANGSERARVTLGNALYDMRPVVGSDGTIYVANSANQVYALTAAGALRWQQAVPGSNRISGVAIGPGDAVFAVDKAANLYALRTTNGQLLWTFTPPTKGKYVIIPGDAVSAPILGPDGTIYYSTLGPNSDPRGYVLALDSSGKLQWAFQAPQAARFFASPRLGPNGTVFVASPGTTVAANGSANVVYGLNSSGQKIYEFATPQPIQAQPAAGSDGSLYVAAGSTLYGLNPNGSQRFAFVQSGATFNTTPVVSPDGSTVYVASAGGVIYALEFGSGAARWNYPLGGTITASPVVEPSGHVIAGSSNSKLVFLSPAGNVDQLVALSNSLSHPPTVGIKGQTAVYVDPSISNGVLTASGSFAVFSRMPAQWDGSPDVQGTGLKNVWKLVNPVAVDVGADLLHQNYGLTGAGVTVAVLDSGVFFDASVKQELGAALQQRFVGQADFVGTGRCGSNTSVQHLTYCFSSHNYSKDNYGHGSHVAGIVWNAASDFDTNVAMGLAPGANVLSVRVLGDDGFGTYVDVIEGIQYVVANKNNFGIEVLNMSLSAYATTPYFLDPLNRAVEVAWASDITVVVAAGNEGPGPASPTPTATLPPATATPTAEASPTPTATLPPAASALHVADLDGSSSRAGQNWDASVTIVVLDGDQNPVAEAIVSGSWSAGSSATCTTDGSGRCTATLAGLSSRTGSVAWAVGGVGHSSLGYDPAANVDPDGDSNGTTITVNKPQPVSSQYSGEDEAWPRLQPKPKRM